MKFDHDIGVALASLLSKKIPNLPMGKIWIKYERYRIYINEKIEETDHTFHLDFTNDKIRIGDLLEEYWLPKLELKTKDDLLDIVEVSYYEVLYPINKELPVRTIREMEKYERFECIVHKETEDNYRITVIPLDYEIELPKSSIKLEYKSKRKFKKKSILRIVLKTDQKETVTTQLKNIEDEEDVQFMEQLMKDTGMTKTIKLTSDDERSQEIAIAQGQEKTCINCHNEFTYFADAESPDFCSIKCKKEFQLVSR